MDIRERIEAFWAGERPDRIPYTIYQNEWRHTSGDPRWLPLYAKGLGVTWHIPTVHERWPGSIEIHRQEWTENGQVHERRTIKTPVGEICETFIDGWRQKFL